MKCFIVSLLTICSSIASAHNNLFFPGDAYFSTKWKVSKVDVKDNSLKLGYYRLSREFMLCGYAGCSNLKVNEIPENYVANLKKANELLKTKYKDLATINQGGESDKTPYFRAFIYNKDYNFSKLGIGYKFNENWAKLQTKDAKRHHAIYDGILSTAFDWEHAADVAGLKLTKGPKSLEDQMGVEEAVEGNAKDYSIVVMLGNYLDAISQAKLDRMFQREQDKDPKKPDVFQFLVIDDKIRLFFRNEKGKIISKELP